MKYTLYLIISLLTILMSCTNHDPEFGTTVSDHFYVRNVEADLPVLVEGNTLNKTFILYVHGGPESGGIVESEESTFFNKLEEDYAVVYYDQRGMGMSNGNFSDNTLTIEQYVDDLDKIITVLKSRYGNDIKFFFLGGSWGGFVGTAYITTNNFQSKINGWIEIGGAHNMPLIQSGLKARIEEVATQQINKGMSVTQWQHFWDYAVKYNINDKSFDNWLDILLKYESLTNLLDKDGELQLRSDNFKAPRETNLLTVLWNDAFNQVGVTLLKRY